ncbi:MAG: sugar phosphate isomerase/epimerase [Armatimonadetes bacterium]|nr:sugar phosphate isomerase/epimerase [Armatimonadota bacterium]
MQLSVITDEISMDLQHSLDVMLEYDVRAVELRSLWNTNIADLTDDQVAKAKAALESRGMVVSCIASPLYKCDLVSDTGQAAGQTHQATDRTLSQQPELLERCIRLCDVFGTRLIRIFAFWKRGNLTEDIERQIVEALASGVARAEQAGVTLVLENEHACYLGTGEDTARVLRTINSPALKAVWDPGNAFCAGEVPYPNGYEAIKDFTVHVHLKDPIRTDDGHCKFVRIGDGAIDYIAQFRALKADGYKGYLSLETHYKPDGDAEKGSRQCLESLRKMLSEI